MRRGWRVLSLLALMLLVMVLGLTSTRASSAQGILVGPLLAQAGVGVSTPAPAVTAEPGKPVVRFFLFFSPTCPHCHEVMNNYLPTVYEKYGDQVEYQYFELSILATSLAINSASCMSSIIMSVCNIMA